MSIKDGEDHGEKIFSFKEPIMTFRKDQVRKSCRHRCKGIYASPCQVLKSGLGNMCLLSFAGKFTRLQILNGPANRSHSPEILWKAATRSQSQAGRRVT